MMMTPAALTEFATGFMLTERLADTAADLHDIDIAETPAGIIVRVTLAERCAGRSEEHTSELQSLMRISYAVFCLKKKKNKNTHTKTITTRRTKQQIAHTLCDTDTRITHRKT